MLVNFHSYMYVCMYNIPNTKLAFVAFGRNVFGFTYLSFSLSLSLSLKNPSISISTDP